MLKIFNRTIRDGKLGLLIYVVAAVVFLLMYVALFPSIQEKSANFNQILDAYPKEMMKAFNVEISALSFNNLQSFLSMEYFSMVWPIMAIALVVSLAASALAGEIEKGTIVFLLGQPITRLNLFWAKYLAGLFSLVVFIIGSILVTIPLAGIYNVDVVAKNYLIVSILAFLFGGAIFSIGFFFSALLSEKGRVAFLTVGLVLVMYVLNIIANLKESLADLKYGSFFYYFDFKSAVVDGKINLESLLVFGGVIIVFTLLAALIFQKRDISA